jgi:hypothetical protein
MPITFNYTPEYFKDIQEALNASGALSKPCHRCGGQEFGILPDFYELKSQGELNIFSNDLKAGIPFAVVFCAKCGFLNLHSIGILESKTLNKKG